MTEISYRRTVAHLKELEDRAERRYAVALARAQREGRTTPVRHKCFISYHAADIEEVEEFVEQFNDVFIPRVVGVSDSDHFKDPIDSKDEIYIKDQIGKKYLRDSTVTILYIGKCTWARKYVDWELSSSLRRGSRNRLNGLMAIRPADGTKHRLSDRFIDNRTGEEYYARLYDYPKAEASLRANIEDAFQARTAREHLINNSRALRQRNSTC